MEPLLVHWLSEMLNKEKVLEEILAMTIKWIDMASPVFRMDSLVLMDEIPEPVLWKEEEKFFYFKIEREKAFQLTIEGLENQKSQLFRVSQTQGHIGRGTIWGEIPTAPVKEFYDILQKHQSNDWLQNGAHLFCLKVTSSKAGMAKGKLIISEEAALVEELRFCFTILEIEFVREDSSHGLELWQYPFTVARYYGIQPEDYFKEKHLKYLKENLQLYKDLGGDTIATTIIHDPWNHQTYDAYPSLVLWRKEGGTFTFDFTWFDQYVELNHSVGIKQKIKCFSLLPWEDKIYYYDEVGVLQQKIYPVGSSEWQEIWGQFLTRFVEHLEKKGWFDQTYIGIDERSAEVLTNVLERLKAYPNSQGHALKVSCAMNYQNFTPHLLDQIADLSISQSHLGDKETFRQLCEERREKGLFTSIYHCVGDYPGMFLYSHPWETQWVLWNTIAYGADGFLRWALDAWVADPLKDGSHWYWESGDPFLIYPEGMRSVRFQQMMEGMNEIRKYQFLKEKNHRFVQPLEEFLQKMPMLEGMTNAYGAQVAANSKNMEVLATQIQQIKKLLEQGTQEYLKELTQ